MFLVMLFITFGVTILGITNVLIIQDKYLYGLYSALLVEMIAAIISLFKKTEFFDDTLPHQNQPDGSAGQGNPLAKYPILGHIFNRMEAQKDDDFLVYTFVCPDTTPVTKTDLDYTSLSYLWADPRGSSIIANLETGKDAMEFNIRFLNEEKTYPSNIAIRPCGKHALKRMPEQNYLCFDAIMPKPCENGLSTISMSFRLIDKMGTHWTRMKGDDLYENEVIHYGADGSWESFCIPLSDGKWRMFKMDGNHRYGKDHPDIEDLIAAVVIEFGSDRREERPGPGKGCIRLRNFRLSDRIV